MTVNINGFTDNGHRFISKLVSRYTIVAIQETKLASKFQYDKVRFHLDHTLGVDQYFLATNDHRIHSAVVEPRRSSGVMLLFNKDTLGFSHLEHLRHLDVSDKYMVVKTKWTTQEVYFHNVYAPVDNDARETFFENLPRDFPPEAIHFVMGDFNLPIDRELDSASGTTQHYTGRKECMTWLQALGVIDAWRLHHPCQRTYSSPRARNRLDYIFVTTRLVEETYHDSSYFECPDPTDHLCHDVRFHYNGIRINRPYWKLPKELLTIPEVCTAIKNEARRLLEQMETANNVGVLWAGWKKRTRRFLQSYHSRYIAHRTYVRDQALLQWIQAQQAHEEGRLSKEKLLVAKVAYESIMDDWHQHHNDLQFDFHATQNETATQHFFRPPKRKLYNVPIVEVYQEDGTSTTDQRLIHKSLHNRWSNIMCERNFKPPNRAARRRFLRVLRTRLTEEQREELDAPITSYEMAEAIKTMHPNKTPGLDGFSAGFYQIDPQLFGEILKRVFAYQLDRGELLGIQRRSAVSLLFKGGDRKNTGNYRPISLIPVEVKILT
ncbi:hypothetical protein LEN26_005388, partial [Aphanomyces euteiches]